ncbi:TPA: hypothetical protein DDW35_05390 [Candidatus Sumerlaeota bacterium]|jgi:phage shock protein B|nr:hypothetical protein [Candidatus Sumerlaeota bacterium]
METCAPVFVVLIGCFALAIPFLFLFGLAFLVLFVLRKLNQPQNISAEETRMIQEMFMGLKRMEDRVDSLETILLDKMKKDEKA